MPFQDKRRPPILILTEKRLLFWICEQNRKGVAISLAMIRAKARDLLIDFEIQLSCEPFIFQEEK